MAAGALLYLIGHFAGAGIAVVMYPVLKKWNAGLALGSVVFRTIEAAFYMVEVVSLLSLLTLSQQFTIAGAADRTLLQAIGNSLVSIREYAAPVAVFALANALHQGISGKRYPLGSSNGREAIQIA